MQTSLHSNGLDFIRAPDVSGQSSGTRQYSASEESLNALKARTTPIDITNPYVSPHASCAHAFLATAINVEHRYDEIHLHLPDVVNTSVIAFSSAAKIENGLALATEISPQPLMYDVQTTINEEPEPHWNFDLLETTFSSPLPQFWLPQADLAPVSAEGIALSLQSSSEPQLLPFVEPMFIAIDEVIIYGLEQGEMTFTGDSPAGTLLHFYLDDVLIGSSETGGEGHWQFTLPVDTPPAQYIFSAVPTNPHGIVGNKVDFPFIIAPKFEHILMPIDENELDLIDAALIELVAPQDEIASALLSPALTKEILEGWRTQDGVIRLDGLHSVSHFDVDELEVNSANWF